MQRMRQPTSVSTGGITPATRTSNTAIRSPPCRPRRVRWPPFSSNSRPIQRLAGRHHVSRQTHYRPTRDQLVLHILHGHRRRPHKNFFRQQPIQSRRSTRFSTRLGSGIRFIFLSLSPIQRQGGSRHKIHEQTSHRLQGRRPTRPGQASLGNPAISERSTLWRSLPGPAGVQQAHPGQLTGPPTIFRPRVAESSRRPGKTNAPRFSPGHYAI
jgi:hypothetical protein